MTIWYLMDTFDVTQSLGVELFDESVEFGVYYLGSEQPVALVKLNRDAVRMLTAQLHAWEEEKLSYE